MIIVQKNKLYGLVELGEVVGDFTESYGLANALQEMKAKGLRPLSAPGLMDFCISSEQFSDLEGGGVLEYKICNTLTGVYNVDDAIFVVHGNGHFLADPEWMRKAGPMLVKRGAVKLTGKEMHYLKNMPAYEYGEFLVQSEKGNLTEPFAVRMEQKLLKELPNGDFMKLDAWVKDPRAIVFGNGRKRVERYAAWLGSNGKRQASLMISRRRTQWGNLLNYTWYTNGVGFSSDHCSSSGLFLGVKP